MLACLSLKHTLVASDLKASKLLTFNLWVANPCIFWSPFPVTVARFCTAAVGELWCEPEVAIVPGRVKSQPSLSRGHYKRPRKVVTGASRQVQMAFLGLEFRERISINREGRGEPCALVQLEGLVPGN